MKFLDVVKINPTINFKTGKDYPFIEMANVSSTNKKPDKYEIKSFDSGVKFQKGDTVIARITPCMENGKRFYCDNIEEGFGSTEFLVFRPKNNLVNNQYLFYYMKSDYIKKIMINSMVGATGRQRVNNDIFKYIEVDLPPIETQEKIADILSNYDDLIENNQKQIKLLEEAAQRLYKKWFADFQFPGHETTPIINSLPQGWKKTVLGKLKYNIESGSRPKGGIDYSLLNGVVSLGAESITKLGQYNYKSEKYITNDFFENMKKGIVSDKDILIYKDGAYIGKTTLFQDEYPYKTMTVNEHVFLLHMNDENLQYYIFFTLYQDLYFYKMQNLNTNSAQPGININSLSTLDIILPNSELICKFNEKIESIMKMIFAKAKQNYKLAEARDRLLPKLMNEEIEV